jgi:hypothetical protein
MSSEKERLWPQSPGIYGFCMGRDLRNILKRHVRNLVHNMSIKPAKKGDTEKKILSA